MPTLETIQNQDTATIIIGASVFSGVIFGVWKKQGLMFTALYAALFGAGGIIINSIFKINKN